METLFFFYNLIIMLCFVFSALGFLLAHRKYREKSLLCLALVFFLFALDNLILFMYEFLPSFTGYYDAEIVVEPYLLMIMTLSIIFSYRLTLVTLRDRIISNRECAFWGVYLAIAFATIVGDWRIGGFLISDILMSMASISVFAFAVLERKKHGAYPNRPGVPGIPMWLLVASMLLEILVLTETILGRFNIFLLRQSHRILGIEALSVLYSVVAIVYLIKVVVDGSAKEKVESPDRGKLIKSFAEFYGLTLREGEILPMMLEGKTNAEICEIACISEGTVKSHTHNIYQKLEVKNRFQLSVKVNEFADRDCQ